MYKSPLDNFQDVYQTQNIQDKFGQSVEELQEMFSEDIKNILAENEINSDEFEIEDVRLYGSYTTGKNKDTSDLDVIVQYKIDLSLEVMGNPIQSLRVCKIFILLKKSKAVILTSKLIKAGSLLLKKKI